MNTISSAEYSSIAGSANYNQIQPLAIFINKVLMKQLCPFVYILLLQQWSRVVASGIVRPGKP